MSTPAKHARLMVTEGSQGAQSAMHLMSALDILASQATLRSHLPNAAMNDLPPLEQVAVLPVQDTSAPSSSVASCSNIQTHIPSAAKLTRGPGKAVRLFNTSEQIPTHVTTRRPGKKNYRADIEANMKNTAATEGSCTMHTSTRTVNLPGSTMVQCAQPSMPLTSNQWLSESFATRTNSGTTEQYPTSTGEAEGVITTGLTTSCLSGPGSWMIQCVEPLTSPASSNMEEYSFAESLPDATTICVQPTASTVLTTNPQPSSSKAPEQSSPDIATLAASLPRGTILRCLNPSTSTDVEATTLRTSAGDSSLHPTSSGSTSVLSNPLKKTNTVMILSDEILAPNSALISSIESREAVDQIETNQVTSLNHHHQFYDNETLNQTSKGHTCCEECRVEKKKEKAQSDQAFVMLTQIFNIVKPMQKIRLNAFSLPLEKIRNLEMLEQMEQKLQSDPTYFYAIVQRIDAAIISQYARHRLHYAIDILFDKKFFAKFSWSGRNNVVAKLQFSRYVNILRLFQAVATNHIGVEVDVEYVEKLIQQKLKHAGERSDYAESKLTTPHYHPRE